jgi:hypothetical protein
MVKWRKRKKKTKHANISKEQEIYFHSVTVPNIGGIKLKPCFGNMDCVHTRDCSTCSTKVREECHRHTFCDVKSGDK